MTGGHCGMVPQEQIVHWSSNDLTAADHDSILSHHTHTCTHESHLPVSLERQHFLKILKALILIVLPYLSNCKAATHVSFVEKAECIATSQDGGQGYRDIGCT